MDDVALEREDLAGDPFLQFDRWWQQVLGLGLAEPNAVVLATASADGAPSARVVLLKGFDEKGFVFFTSYDGRKARELSANPRAALCFHWEALGRQVRVEGRAKKLPRADSEAYFRTRARGSQIGAWSSPQSEVIEDRAELEARVAEFERKFEGQEVPLPPRWGGYVLVPQAVEFWQNRASRLHDRLRYRQGSPGEGWIVERLAP